MEPLVRCLFALAVVGLLLDVALGAALVVCWVKMRRRHAVRMRAALGALVASLRLAREVRSASRAAPRS